MTMNLNAEEQQAVEIYRADPKAQADMWSFNQAQGAEYGRLLTEMVLRETSISLLLSNSGRVGVAEILAKALADRAVLLRETIGDDETNVEIYITAAKAELAWLGVL